MLIFSRLETNTIGYYPQLIGKYLSGLRQLDHVIVFKEGFEAQL